MKLTNQEILEKYSNMKPGKYWSLPKNKKHLIDNYLVSEDYLPMVKVDGYWSRIIITDEVLIQSRGISKVTNTYGDYTPLVPHIAEELKKSYPSGTVLLGELAYDDLSRTAREVGSILRCKAPKAIERQKVEKNKIHLFIFDVLVYNKEELIELPFEERFSHNYLKLGGYIHTPKIATSKDAKALLEWVWSKGGEGIILIKKDLPYKIGNAQAWHSIKVKRELGDLEGKVISIIKPNKEYKGKELDSWKYWEGDTPVTKPYYMNQAVGVVVEYKGRAINITSGTTDDDGAWLMTDAAKNAIAEGKLYASFTGMELTEDSVRHPRLLRLRDDL